MNSEQKHIVIIGAGFAGLFAAKKLSGRNVRVTIIDRNNYHTFNPLLYQVGAAEIEPDQIAYPVRTFIRKKANIDFIMADGQAYLARNRERRDAVMELLGEPKSAAALLMSYMKSEGLNSISVTCPAWVGPLTEMLHDYATAFRIVDNQQLIICPKVFLANQLGITLLVL